MNDFSDELSFWLTFKQDVSFSLTLIELELVLANPLSHTDDEHQFLIKKARSFRDIITEVDQKIRDLSKTQ